MKNISDCIKKIILCFMLITFFMPHPSYASETDPEIFKIIEKSARENYEENITLMSDNGKTVKGLGIDVYSGQKTINWDKVKAAGIDFAFIRVGYRGWGHAGTLCKDTYMSINLQNAKKAGIKVGVFFYATAVSVAEAKEEAAFVLSLLNGIALDYPVCYDYEGYDVSYYRNYNISSERRTQFAIAFLDTIEAAGYKGLMYGSAGHLRDNREWDTDQLEDKYDIWVAQYWLNENDEEYHDIATAKDKETSYTGRYRFWQCSSQGRVDGINDYVDLDIEYEEAGNIASSKKETDSEVISESSSDTGTTKTSAETAITLSSDNNSFSASTAAKKYYIALDEVNYRSSPGFSGSVLGQIPRGTKVKVYSSYDKVRNGYTWYKLSYNGRTVYAAACYFRLPKSAVLSYVTYKTKSALRYRRMPTVYGRCMGMLSKGQRIRVVKGYSVRADGRVWFRFKYRGKFYYAAAGYLKKCN